MSVYKLENLGMVYGENHALKDLSLDITHRSLGLIGKSGSGKTTLLRILSGLQSQTSGDLFFNEDKGHVVIDISAELVTGHPGGVAAEQATLTVLLRTIAANFPRIRKCSLLVDGAQVETLAGHVRTDRPFVPSRWH